MLNLKIVFSEPKIRNRIIIFSATALVFIVLLFSSIFFVYGTDTIYIGVSVNGTNIGGLTKEKANALIASTYTQDKMVTITYEKNEKTLSFDDFEGSYDYSKIVDKAYNMGRQGSFFKRANEIIRLLSKKEDIDLILNYNEEKLKGGIVEFAYENSESTIDNEITITDKKMIIKKGKGVNAINSDKLHKSVIEHLLKYNFEPVRAVVEYVEPEPLDAEKIYNEYRTEPIDAYINKTDGKMNVVKEVVGVYFDLEELKKILSEDKEVYEVPVKITYPKVTYNSITGTLFQNVLSTYTTNYNGNDVNRTNNLRLATNKINGTILNPGQIFSYNDIVGRRTYNEGYRDAKVYVAGEVVDGMAGGICQVSSTLYAAVCYADLKIVSRMNHQLTVGYVPLGLDATVVYGAIDFKFTNNTSAPIKIVASAGGGSLSIKILGTNDDPGKKVTMSNTTIATHPFTEIIRENKDVPQGQTVVKQKGSNGYTVSTYRIVTRNGVTIKNEFMGNSKYSATNLIKEVHSATDKPILPDETPSPSPSPLPVQTPTPSPIPTTPTSQPTLRPTSEPYTPSPEPEVLEEDVI